MLVPRALSPAPRLLLGATLLVALAACDSGAGPVDLDARPPVVADLVASPDSLAFDPAASGDSVAVTMEIGVQARDPDGDLERVAYVVMPPLAGAEPVAEGVLPPAGGDRFANRVAFGVPRGLNGLYTVRVYAVDDGGRLSNEVRGGLHLTGTARPPTVEAVSPDAIERPASGTREVRLEAAVSDPDGLANVARVELWNAAQPGARFPLFDDGQGGDREAGDGRYTVTFEIGAANEPGTVTFFAQATDRYGLESDVFRKDIVIR